MLSTSDIIAFVATANPERARTFYVPAQHTVLGWRVPDIRATVEALTNKGVAFERYTGLPQDETGVWRSPSGAQVAWFKDPDGNVLSLTQNIA